MVLFGMWNGHLEIANLWSKTGWYKPMLFNWDCIPRLFIIELMVPKLKIKN